jgi:hypothetical protein
LRLRSSEKACLSRSYLLLSIENQGIVWKAA